MWIDEVRRALQLCGEELDLLHETLSDFPYYYEPDDRPKALENRATKAYKQALAAMPDEPEMMKLLQILEDWCTGIGEIGRVLTMDDKILIGVIRQTIEREFGYSLEEANSVKENDSPEKA